MRLALLLMDGVGYRNFVLSSFLEQAARAGDVSVIHYLPEEAVAEYAHIGEGHVEWRSGTSAPDEPISYTLRYSLIYAQLYWTRPKVLEVREAKPIRGSWRTNLSQNVSKTIGKIAASPRGIQVLNQLHMRAASRLPEVEYYRNLFRQIKPTIVLCSKQWSQDAIHPVIAAQSLGIPTVTFIFSWDNLTTKGRIAAPFDHYLVWSALMRDELLHYYPDVGAEQVHIVGTPQFEAYADKRLLWSREEFFRRIGGDPSRPLICYSSGIPRTCPEDQDHAMILMQLIRDGKIRHNPQVILRPAPPDKFERYDALRREFPEMIYAPPLWNSIGAANSSRIPSADDVQFLANLTHHADMNVNMASTMTLDFAIHDKPVVNIAFDVADPPYFNKPIWDLYYQFEHYRPVVELGAARFARSSEELAEHINAYLENPSLDREQRRKLVELEVGQPLEQSNQIIVDTLLKLSVPQPVAEM